MHHSCNVFVFFFPSTEPIRPFPSLSHSPIYPAASLGWCLPSPGSTRSINDRKRKKETPVRVFLLEKKNGHHIRGGGHSSTSCHAKSQVKVKKCNLLPAKAQIAIGFREVGRQFFCHHILPEKKKKKHTNN